LYKGIYEMTRDKIILLALLTVVACGVLLLAAWSVMGTSAMTSVINPQPTQQVRGQPFARVIIPKPSAVAAGKSPALLPTVEIPLAVATITAQPEIVSPQIEATPTAQVSSVETPTVPDSPPGSILAAIVPDTPTPEYKPSTGTYVPVTGSGEHWIDVDLSQQRVYAYEGDTVVNSFVVSTGTWQTPTVTGKFSVWTKLRSTTMSGPGYYLTNVPYVMYFYKSYGLHGTYWHNNFGTPMSHGCVNLSIPDAEWLYNFASVGTVVNVHY
jgi:lipoprotein-anchoring transpeptidase ErfK/SrfK